ncbi:MAG: NAD(P)(+) transhydrogenase (Re/Si-specific) subunit beta, partial [Acidimicrobiales bacterium]
MTAALHWSYLAAAACFILALRGLSSPRHARRGNLIGALGMLVALVVTLVAGHIHNGGLLAGAMVIGVAIGVPAARLVKMTAMPQMVAAFNGVGGGAAAVISVTEFIGTDTKAVATYKVLEVVFGVLVGAVSFAGSTLAFVKLQELMTT